ncbi:MAG: hypothetical protein M0C28_23275 [Candidatus Moduliflexus flocculans]|nr:hypothetical protein [Candidatus Moduliflexus flocculans]
MRRGLLYARHRERDLRVVRRRRELAAAAERTCRHAPVSWITVQEHFNDLVISHLRPRLLDHGRHRAAAADDAAGAGVATRTCSRRGRRTGSGSSRRRRRRTTTPRSGENPKYGASISYYLKAAAPEPVTLTILDAKGEVVRTLTGTGRAGLNRVHWDLRGEPSRHDPDAHQPPRRPRRTSGWGPRAGGRRLAAARPSASCSRRAPTP